MQLTISDTLQVTIDGKKTNVDVQFRVEDGDRITGAALLDAVSAALGGQDAGRGTSAPAGVPAAGPATQEKPAEEQVETWAPPEELHGKAWKSVHRVIDAIGRAGGRGLTVAEIQDKARISAVPVYKMLKDDTAQGRYATRYLRTTKLGRSQVVDLTPAGRKLASLIRAGKVPV